ncbi:hypothetical protein [Thiolapillus sp.]|uniref:hypothetical protein n=1 Tax=Thiolapillus sp. TaxID=2017437 RepID=UPI003AF74F70
MSASCLPHNLPPSYWLLPIWRLLSLCRFVVAAGLDAWLLCLLAALLACWPSAALLLVLLASWSTGRQPQAFSLSACVCWFAFGGHIAALPVICAVSPFHVHLLFLFYRLFSYSVVHLDIFMFSVVYSFIVDFLFVFAFVYSFIVDFLFVFAFVLFKYSLLFLVQFVLLSNR